MFQKVAILGPGLLGSSLALAIRQKKLAKTIALWTRRPEIITQLQKKKIGDLITTEISEAVKNADFIIFATPIGTMAKLAQECLPHLAKDVWVTDVGSVKNSVVSLLEKIFENKAHFIGSHPMAGSDKTGFEHAHVELFNNAACFVTPTEETSAQAQPKIAEFWTALGCRLKMIPPHQHDRLVAAISHLPHLLASLLVNTVTDLQTTDALQWVGGGFRDSTRIALGSPVMWNEILSQNRDTVLQTIRALRQHLNEAEQHLQNHQSLEPLLKQAAKARQTLASEN